ncbi:MAG TPA: dTDP-4-dehydrorhamnose reductase [Polyangia bacterium]
MSAADSLTRSPRSAAPPKVLLIGADGMLGRAFRELLARERAPFRSLMFPEIDLTSDESVDRALAADMDVDVVINCAAWTDVDGAETREEEATAVNGAGAGRLAVRCAARGALLVHYSTDYVFNGEASSPYPVEAPLDPVNAYGRSKAVGERLLAASGCRHLLLRTSWLYAPWAKNFVRTIAELAKKRDTLRVVEDQRGRPTSAEHLARVSWTLLGQALVGGEPHRTFHVTDGGACSWFEFARAITDRVAPQCRVEPCLAAEFPRPARRPTYSVLDIGDTETAVGFMSPWRDNLADVLARLESP